MDRRRMGERSVSSQYLLGLARSRAADDQLNPAPSSGPRADGIADGAPLTCVYATAAANCVNRSPGRGCDKRQVIAIGRSPAWLT
jgi:hypothetical protein